jgi:hypothetical protein
VELGEELCELRLGAGGADGRNDRSDALESDDDVGCEEPELLSLVGHARERSGSVLVGDRSWVSATDCLADELAEQCALVLKAGVDSLR